MPKRADVISTPLPAVVTPRDRLPPQFVKWIMDRNILIHMATVLDGELTSQGLREAVPMNADQRRWVRSAIIWLAECRGVSHSRSPLPPRA